jgi:hypothetical protein
MDKDLPNNIGWQFKDAINAMSRQPRAQVWDHISKHLDQTHNEKQRLKAGRLKKKAVLLLLLFFAVSISGIIFIWGSGNKSANRVYTGNYPAWLQWKNNSLSQKYPVQNETSGNQLKQIQTANTNILSHSEFIHNRSISMDDGKNLSEWPLEKSGLGARFTGTAGFENDNSKEFYDNQELCKELNPLTVTANNNTGIQIENTKISDLLWNAKKDYLVPFAIKKIANKNKQNKPSRFAFTAFMAPDYTEYILKNDRKNSYDNKAGIEKREHSDLSFAAGALLAYGLGKKLSIQSGIIYSSTDISISPTSIYAEKDNNGSIKYRYNTSAGYGYLLPGFSISPAVGDSLFADGANHTLQYISIPVLVKYRFGNKKIRFNPGIGFTINFLTKSTLTTDLVDAFNRETETITKIESIKKTGVRLLMAPEWQYRFSENWSISVMPYVKYALGPINKGNVVKTYPYTVGLGFGFSYKY